MHSELKYEMYKTSPIIPMRKKFSGILGHRRLIVRANSGMPSRRLKKGWGAPKRCLAFAAPLAALPLLLLLATDPRRGNSMRLRQEFADNNSFVFRRGTDSGSGGSSKMALKKDLTAAEMESIEERMEIRKGHVEKKCNALPQTNTKPNAWEFLINKQYHLIWCNVFKAASSSWMFNFNLMANYSASFLDKSRDVPLNLARKRYPRPTVEELKEAQTNSTTFLIVRHPFERLSSAYKDKLEFALPNSLHSRLGKKIILRYRAGPKSRVIGEPRWPSFEEFVRYLLDEVKAGKELDMHWVPITKFCTPCQIHFDIIAKFETLQEDQNFLIQKMGLQDIVKPQWKNSGKGRNTSTLLMTHYSQLTTQQIWGLYGLYIYDFQLFNYTIDPFLEVAKDYNPRMKPATHHMITRLKKIMAEESLKTERRPQPRQPA